MLPLASASEGQQLRDTYTDFVIPDAVLERLTAAGDAAAQQKEGLAVCTEIINQLKDLPGLRGIHLITGGHEASLPELIAAAAR